MMSAWPRHGACETTVYNLDPRTKDHHLLLIPSQPEVRRSWLLFSHRMSQALAPFRPVLWIICASPPGRCPFVSISDSSNRVFRGPLWAKIFTAHTHTTHILE